VRARRDLGYFRARWPIATCLVDAERQLFEMLRAHHFDDTGTAKTVFADPH
jgi:hypothetical protein